MTECLMAIFRAKGDMLNTCIEDDNIVRMLMPVVPAKVARGRKYIRKKLREENKDMKTGH